MSEQQPEVDEVEFVDENAAQTVSFAHPDGWVYLTHEASGGTTRIADDPDVLAAQQARGWTVVEPPDPDAPVVPVIHTGPEPAAAGGPEWIAMSHPESGGTQLLPNDAAAIAGARDAGWVTAVEATAAEAAQIAASVAERTVAEVLEFVGTDPVKADAALTAERDGKNRSSLIRALEDITASADNDNNDTDPTEQ